MLDVIEKRALLLAPRSRVWRAISDRTEFGKWFGVRFPAGSFTAGEQMSGSIANPGYEHLTMTIDVVEVVPEERFSYRWHPGAIDPEVDYSSEPMTVVTFTLADAPEGTLLTIDESGFDQIPEPRRAEAYRLNEGGWEEQTKRIARHVA